MHNSTLFKLHSNTHHFCGTLIIQLQVRVIWENFLLISNNLYIGHNYVISNITDFPQDIIDRDFPINSSRWKRTQNRRIEEDLKTFQMALVLRKSVKRWFGIWQTFTDVKKFLHWSQSCYIQHHWFLTRRYQTQFPVK